MSETNPPIDPMQNPPEDEIPLAESTGPASPPLPPITPIQASARITANAAPEVPVSTKDEQTMGMLAHLLGIFTGFLGPLILWLIKKDESKYIDEQAKEALNFQIAAAIVIFGLLFFMWIPFLNVCVIIPLSLAAHVVRIVFSILGTVAASKGEMYRYPFTLRLIK